MISSYRLWVCMYLHSVDEWAFAHTRTDSDKLSFVAIPLFKPAFWGCMVVLICDKKRREHQWCSCRQQYTEIYNACELYPRCRFCGSAEYIATHFLSAKYVSTIISTYTSTSAHTSTNISLTKRFNWQLSPSSKRSWGVGCSQVTWPLGTLIGRRHNKCTFTLCDVLAEDERAGTKERTFLIVNRARGGRKAARRRDTCAMNRAIFRT